MKSLLQVFIASAFLTYCSAGPCEVNELADVKKLRFLWHPKAEDKSENGTFVLDGKGHLHCLNLYLCMIQKGGGISGAECTNPGDEQSWDLSKWKCGADLSMGWLTGANLVKLECRANTQQCIEPEKCSLKYAPELTAVGLGIALVIAIVATLLLVGLCCGIARCCCPSGDRKSYR